MDDLPGRLREKAAWLQSRSFAVLDGSVCREAADKIEELEAEAVRLGDSEEVAWGIIANSYEGGSQ